MKLLELVVEKTRGIVDLRMKPDGRNMLLWGPNGSGKSAAVDALDFLLTGNISRLGGPGTRDLSLAKNGPHIDYKPLDAVVRALVLLPGQTQPVEISRSMDKPNTLVCPHGVRQDLERIEGLARGHSHLLTRRDILRFISVEAGARAQMVQAVLALWGVEETRQALRTAANQLNTAVNTEAQELAKRRQDVASAAQEQDYDPERILRIVNEKRELLSAEPVIDLKADLVQSGIDARSISEQAGDGTTSDVGLVEGDVASAKKILASELSEDDRRLRELLAIVRSDPELHHALLHLDLTNRGLDLLDDSGKCPLCDAEWGSEALRQKLEERRDRGEEAKKYQDEIDRVAAALKKTVDSLSSTIIRLVEPAEQLGLEDDTRQLREWHSSLDALSQVLAAPVDNFDSDKLPADSVCSLYAPDRVHELWASLVEAAKTSQPAEAPSITAWKLLVRLAIALEHIEEAAASEERARLTADRADLLRQSFQGARDDILGELYKDAIDRFVDFYKVLHPDEAEHFTAELQASEAALGFAADFYGRGLYPPLAFHSEGHQDSMGLCLFLALTSGAGQTLQLLILDDVIMSVDRDHRKAVCRLLRESLPERQLFLTTHDRTWASQTVSQGLVERHDFVEFRRWTLETGPVRADGEDVWEKIEQALASQNVEGAAHSLRTFGEEFFEEVCDALKARVTYRSDGQWTLADFFSGAQGRIYDLLKVAKNAANSWQQPEELERLALVESRLKQLYANHHVEEKAINREVHFNAWYEYSPDEFQDVVDALRSISEQFKCESCAMPIMLSVELAGGLVAVTCPCATFHWNLQKKAP